MKVNKIIRQCKFFDFILVIRENEALYTLSIVIGDKDWYDLFSGSLDKCDAKFDYLITADKY